MKKLLCIIICILAVTGLAGCKDVIDEGSGEYYILELTENKISDEKEFAITDEKGTVWLENTDVDKVLVVFEKSKNRYLELRLTDDGAKKFKKALKKNKDSVLSITLGGEVLASPVVADDAEENSIIVTGEYEYVISWFNSLT